MLINPIFQLAITLFTTILSYTLIVNYISKEMIEIFIFYNGKGFVEVSKGLRLLHMEARINRVNGDITYGSNGEQGFHIHIDIPYLGVS